MMMMMMIMIMAEHHGAEDGDGDNWTNIFLRIGGVGIRLRRVGDHKRGFRFVLICVNQQNDLVFTTGFRFSPVISRVSCGQ
jgi:hypothetical protein